jgi:hypothetical protein
VVALVGGDDRGGVGRAGRAPGAIEHLALAHVGRAGAEAAAVRAGVEVAEDPRGRSRGRRWP